MTKTMRLTTRRYWEFKKPLAERIDFKTGGALRGALHDPTRIGGFGQLDPKYWNEVQASTYIVWSYETPIAWYNALEGTWTMPDRKYSVTTSNHQGRIRTALTSLGVAIQ